MFRMGEITTWQHYRTGSSRLVVREQSIGIAELCQCRQTDVGGRGGGERGGRGGGDK